MVSECQCPTQFPMIRVSEGKYRIGDTKVLIFVRVSFFLLFLVVMDSDRARHANYSTLPHLTRKMKSNWPELARQIFQVRPELDAPGFVASEG